MSDDVVATERRKILAKSLPYMLSAVWEAHQVLSPGYLASTAVEQYEKIEKNARINREELAAVTRYVGMLNLQSDGTGRLSVTLTKSQLLALIANYLSAQYFGQSSRDAELIPSPAVEGYDGMLTLPSKSVFVRVLKEDLDKEMWVKEVNKAETLNPNDVCIICHETSHKTDILFDPVFVGENKVQRGRFRLMSLADLFGEISKKKFTAIIEKSKEPLQDDSVRILFVKSG